MRSELEIKNKLAELLKREHEAFLTKSKKPSPSNCIFSYYILTPSGHFWCCSLNKQLEKYPTPCYIDKLNSLFFGKLCKNFKHKDDAELSKQFDSLITNLKTLKIKYPAIFTLMWVLDENNNDNLFSDYRLIYGWRGKLIKFFRRITEWLLRI